MFFERYEKKIQKILSIDYGWSIIWWKLINNHQKIQITFKLYKCELLGNFFQERGHSVNHAEYDADTHQIIFKHSPGKTHHYSNWWYWYLILLLYHISKSFSCSLSRDLIVIFKSCKDLLERKLSKNLLFACALTGCDINSVLLTRR